MFSFFKNKEFDLENYLVNGLGYSKKNTTESYSEYIKDRYTIFIFKNKIGYNNMGINFDDVNMVSINFLPNSKLMTDMILNSIKNELYKNEEI